MQQSPFNPLGELIRKVMRYAGLFAGWMMVTQLAILILLAYVAFR
jgi:hypothetical protein